MTYRFFVHGQLPSLNDMIDACKAGKRNRGSVYNRQKQNADERVALAARHLPKLVPKVDIVCDWYEPNARRDPDNIAAAHKFILDGLVKAGKLDGDSRKYVNALADRFPMEKGRVGVMVTIFDQGEET